MARRPSQKQVKAVYTLVTARTWTARIGALAILIGAGYSWYANPPFKPARTGSPPKGSVQGTVTAVSDGDTVTVVDGDLQYKVRLAFIDAPEKAQPFGPRARQQLADRVLKQKVEVEVIDTDRYGRTVGRVRMEGADINYEQVAKGLAWHYTQFAKGKQSGDDFGRYEDAMDKARHQRAGLWSDPGPTAPWDYRRSQKEARGG